LVECRKKIFFGFQAEAEVPEYQAKQAADRVILENHGGQQK